MILQNIKEDKKYKDVVHVSEMELQAIEQLALQDGEIYQPLILWKGEDTLVYGYQYLPVLKAYPQIKYVVREMAFEDWQEAQVWAVEHYIAQPTLSLWQKLEAAVNCESYWLMKEEAKGAQGKRTDLSSESEGKLEGSKEVNAIIALKVGCSVTSVYNIKKILASGRSDIITLCRSGKLSISAAYARLFVPKKPNKVKPNTAAPVTVVMDSGDLFDGCEQYLNASQNSNDITPVDPQPIADKIRSADVPEDSIWIALHKKDGQIQVVQRHYDQAKGTVLAKINAYTCKLIENADDRIIWEAKYIPASITQTLEKDDRQFDQSSQMAS